MMRKILKYISVFPLWLAGFTLSAHMFIPHDHHLAEPYSNQDKNCPAPNNKSDHKSGFPLHCHAFNDLASEKVRLYHVSQNFQFSFTFLNVLTDYNAPDLQNSCTSIIDFQKPIFDSYALELSLLRAPPALA